MKKDVHCLKRAGLFIYAVILICLFPCIRGECFRFWNGSAPTATVIDDETEQPIEGAVAIAIWREHSSTMRAWWEGGTDAVVRIEEVVTDLSGNIYIDGFWNWHFLESRYPHLTIYKPGYVCWDQGNIYVSEFNTPERTDFDKDHRIARMKKWPEGFSFIGHETFIGVVTCDDYTKAPKQIFYKAYDYEVPFRVNERTERDKNRKEMEKDKGR